MIIELLLRPIFALLRFAMQFIPSMGDNAEAPVQVVYLMEIIGVAFYIFPPQLFFIFIANSMFWMSAHMGWAIIEWVYKKIPGVN
ncbi:MAG: hypothetical protein FWC16_03420 [Defluviitaleaceae bacterium]|nr:hypothetical protein [Defluviitaleaceae bacterium]MCL2273952.1 hypothetical protein [Defluviitaleaceae bacterium]